jgi:hypothetical protein
MKAYPCRESPPYIGLRPEFGPSGPTCGEDRLRFLNHKPAVAANLWFKRQLGAHRQFVFGEDSRQRLPEIALVSGSLLMYLAATQPAHSTGFWDRTPQPTAGRLRRQLAQQQYSEDWPMLANIRKKNAVTEHLPKGITAHRRTPGYVRASSAPT